jgi:predicted anti-sigma-YlaC factor YlaD
MTCEETRRHIHEAHDDDRGAPLPELVRAHVAACTACRDFEGDLRALTDALRALPPAPLPGDVLDAVWRRTIRARPAVAATTIRPWRLAAAAAFVTVLSTASLYFVFAPARPPGPSSVELARASAQADMVFGYTARALAATRDAAADRVLASKVSPAVRGVVASHPPRRPRS